MKIASIEPSETVAVLGAGNMGSGIAQACAEAGFNVRVRDVDDAALARGRGLIERTLEGAVQRKKSTPAQNADTLARITFTTDLAAAVTGAALVIEAVFEDENVKKALFAEIGPKVRPDALVVSNTSSFSVARLAEGFPSPNRFAGLHFFFPAAVNKLVEVIGHPQTDPQALATLERFSYRLRKIPVRVRDSPGFAVNRFFVPYLNEAARLAEEMAASLATIEDVGRDLFGTSLGPFELMNVTGIPIAFHSMESLERAFGPAYAPSKLLGAQFKAGTPWDWKSGRVEPALKDLVRDRLLGLVFGIATRLVEEGVASAEATDRAAVVGLRWKRGPFALLNANGLRRGYELVEAHARRWGNAFPVAQELKIRAGRGETKWPLKYVRTERQGSVAWVLLDRPEVLNSLNTEVLDQIGAAFQSLAGDRTARVVVLAGASPVFAAGADIAEMAEKNVPDGRAFGFSGQAVCKRIEEFPRPVIALVEGYALGGGLELALACDFVIAADGAQLGLPEVTVGIHPGFGGASRLTRIIGRSRTKLLVYTGVPVSAQEAARLGFVTRVVPAASARLDVQALAEMIAERAPFAVSSAKAVIDQGQDAALDAALRLEGESAGHTFATQDRTEGMRAFLERRKPKFTGD
ncbi:MAG TPA: enoyl-CoA hydratase-related protein [Thermoplasmata archaeon]|nr:enoyl-CoA hydratase-related protein [Thermoplasmata archaeon]